MRNFYLTLSVILLLFISGCTSISIPLSNSTSQKSIQNSNMYNNVISQVTLPTNYSEVCFKNGTTFTDLHGINESSEGGNCLIGDTGFIIEKVERTPETWEFAIETCLQQGMRLPTEFEYKISCRQRNFFDLFFMINNWEWVSNNAYPSSTTVSSSIMGNGGCNYGNSGLVGTNTGGEGTYHYRCVK